MYMGTNDSHGYKHLCGNILQDKHHSKSFHEICIWPQWVFWGFWNAGLGDQMTAGRSIGRFLRGIRHPLPLEVLSLLLNLPSFAREGKGWRVGYEDCCWFATCSIFEDADKCLLLEVSRSMECYAAELVVNNRHDHSSCDVQCTHNPHVITVTIFSNVRLKLVQTGLTSSLYCCLPCRWTPAPELVW